MKRPGFFGGLGAFFRGFGFLVRTPKAWPYAAVPVAILVLLASLAFWLGLGVLRPEIFEALAPYFAWDTASWLGTALGFIAQWLAVATVTGLLLALAYAITAPLSGPALEKLVTYQEDEFLVPEREPIGLLQEMWCGLRAQMFWLVVSLPVVIVISALDLVLMVVFSPATFVTAALKFLVVSFGLAWNLLDYPLTLRGVRMRERFSFIMKHKREVLGFGVAFGALFLIPCFSVLLLPIGSAAATRLLWTILRDNPDALPQLADEARVSAGTVPADPALLSSGPPQSPVGVATESIDHSPRT